MTFEINNLSHRYKFTMKAIFATALLAAAKAVDLESIVYGYGLPTSYGYEEYGNAQADYSYVDTNHFKHDTRTIKCPEGQVYNCEYDYKHYGIYDSSDYDEAQPVDKNAWPPEASALSDSDVHDYIYRDGYGGVDLTDSDSDYYHAGAYNHYSFSDDDELYYGYSASDDDYHLHAGKGELGYRYEGPDFSHAYGNQKFYRIVVCDERNTNCRNEYRPGPYLANHGIGLY